MTTTQGTQIPPFAVTAAASELIRAERAQAVYLADHSGTGRLARNYAAAVAAARADYDTVLAYALAH